MEGREYQNGMGMVCLKMTAMSNRSITLPLPAELRWGEWQGVFLQHTRLSHKTRGGGETNKGMPYGALMKHTAQWKKERMRQKDGMPRQFCRPRHFSCRRNWKGGVHATRVKKCLVSPPLEVLPLDQRTAAYCRSVRRQYIFAEAFFFFLYVVGHFSEWLSVRRLSGGNFNGK